MSKRKIDQKKIEGQHPEDEIPEPLTPIEEAKLLLKDTLSPIIAEDGELFPEIQKAIDNLVNVVDEQALHAVREEISVYYPEQLFSPAPYNSFRCGNLFYKTVVLPGETREQAYERAWNFISNQVHKQYDACKADFWARYSNQAL